MIHFYKPNSKNTGTACSFWHNSKEGSFFGSFIKQHSWNSQGGGRGTGSFSKNKGNPQKEVIIKFNQMEIASLIDCTERDDEFSGYHRSQKQVVNFKFGPYFDKEKEEKVHLGDVMVANEKATLVGELTKKEKSRKGFSWGANKEATDDAVNKVSFVISFDFGEAVLLKEHLRFMLHDVWSKNSQEFERKQMNQSSNNDIKVKEHNLKEELDEDNFDF